MNVKVTTCPGKTLWLASTNSIFTLCAPGGSPAMSTVLLSLASAHNQGRSSTVMCRYWAWKMPWASGPGSGGSTISLGAGSFSIVSYGEAPRFSLALWAKAVVALLTGRKSDGQRSPHHGRPA